MADSLAEAVLVRIEPASRLYCRLILVVSPESARTAALATAAGRCGVERVNLSLELSRHLLDLPASRRVLSCPDWLDDIAGAGAAPLFLDHIELLFTPELQQDPLRLLRNASRRRVIVAAWPGRLEGPNLAWAEPGHREHGIFPPEGIELISPGVARDDHRP